MKTILKNLAVTALFAGLIAPACAEKFDVPTARGEMTFVFLTDDKGERTEAAVMIDNQTGKAYRYAKWPTNETAYISIYKNKELTPGNEEHSWKHPVLDLRAQMSDTKNLLAIFADADVKLEEIKRQKAGLRDVITNSLRGTPEGELGDNGTFILKYPNGVTVREYIVGGEVRTCWLTYGNGERYAVASHGSDGSYFVNIFEGENNRKRVYNFYGAMDGKTVFLKPGVKVLSGYDEANGTSRMTAEKLKVWLPTDFPDTPARVEMLNGANNWVLKWVPVEIPGR